MDLPDYDKAAHAAEALTANHRGQHRCTDGIYYGPRDAGNCPTQAAVQALCDTIDATRALPHQACHDQATVEAVAQAMVFHPTDGRVVPLASLDPVQRAWWIDKTRLAMEAHAALLDPSVTV